ncbi:MAG: UDP-2,3-diacylglucosamine diphosphatase [Saprospiraceae bacterium]|nr:UDP-2,3-diacylglucosamine diphosphatase [Saprospiraceae bacterium]
MSYTYFASDFHLGLNTPLSSREREIIIVSWLEDIMSSCSTLYLLGDLFDFWFEYKEVVPKGHFRLLTMLSKFHDQGIPVHVFTGNHDMWMFGYLEEECGVTIHRSPITAEINHKKFLLGHGDGLGPGDHGYKLIKKVFRNRINQWLFARLHPNFAIKLMKISSKTSREADNESPEFMGPEKEWLVQYCERKLEDSFFDYFIFGHRHIPIDYTLSNQKSRYINTGDWLSHFSYARFDGTDLQLLKYTP